MRYDIYFYNSSNNVNLFLKKKIIKVKKGIPCVKIGQSLNNANRALETSIYICKHHGRERRCIGRKIFSLEIFKCRHSLRYWVSPWIYEKWILDANPWQRTAFSAVNKAVEMVFDRVEHSLLSTQYRHLKTSLVSIVLLIICNEIWRLIINRVDNIVYIIIVNETIILIVC